MGLAIATVAVVVAATQLLLPVIVARSLKSRLARDGRVLRVKVRAFPAIRLLWQHADSISVRMADYHAAPSQVAELLHGAGEVGRLSVSIGRLSSGLLTVHDVALSKQGSELSASGRIQDADLKAALPIIDSLTAVSSSDGELTLRGRAGAMGLSASVTAAVTVSDGRVTVTPTGLLGGFVSLTVFNDPNVYVHSLSGAAVPGGLRVSARAELR